MKCLSVRQPWAHFIINGEKDVENRKWSTKLRGRVLIHASKQVDEEVMKRFNIKEHLPTGCIVGHVEIVDCVQEYNSAWFQGPFGFVLREAVKITPFKYKGQLGFFEVNEDILK